MMSRLLMTRTFVFPVSLIFMIAGSLGIDSSICSTWTLDQDSENNQDSSFVLWEKNDCPLIDCALFCGMDPSCRSFFHHPSSEMCLGSRSYKRGLPGSHVVQQGWKYYTRPQRCDGEYIYNQTLGVCYKLYMTAKNYWDAMAVCEEAGAKLLIIRNDDQLKYFSNLQGAAYWLRVGLRSTMANTVWRWWNGQTASNITWFFGKPDYYAYETCAIIKAGKYTNEGCSFGRYFLCQKHI